MTISKVKDCCGVVSTIEPMKILPGSNAVCRSTFTTRNRYGPQDKQILIASNDRKNPYYELKMTGTLLKPVEVSPRYLRLGNLLPGSQIIQSITATNLLEQSVTLESVKSTIPGIHAEVADADRISTPRRSWEVRISTKGALEVGKLSGRIQLRSERSFDVLSFRFANTEGLVEANRLADGKWQLSLWIDSSSIQNGARLIVETNCAQQSIIEIPVNLKQR